MVDVHVGPCIGASMQVCVLQLIVVCKLKNYDFEKHDKVIWSLESRIEVRIKSISGKQFIDVVV